MALESLTFETMFLTYCLPYNHLDGKLSPQYQQAHRSGIPQQQSAHHLVHQQVTNYSVH